MIYRSRYLSDKDIESRVFTAEANAYPSRRDGCRVTLMQCSECARMFEEELESAKAKIADRQYLFCLECDDEADVPALTGATILIWWSSE